MIWKEPLQARQHSIKQSMAFQQKRLLKLILPALFSGPLMMACLFLVNPQKISDWHVLVRPSLIYSSICLVFLFVHVGCTMLSARFEATYLVDEKGIRIRRALIQRTLLWRFIRGVEVVPHPTLANIALLRIVYRVMNKPVTNHWVMNILVMNNEQIDELPFEPGQIDAAAIAELHPQKNLLK